MFTDFEQPLSKKAIAAAIARAPAIEPVLKKLVSKVSRGVKLPETFSAAGLDYAAQGELERLFGTRGQKLSDERFYVSLPPFFSDTSFWGDALDYFGFSDKQKIREDVFERLKLFLPPQLEYIAEVLASKEEIARFARKPENAPDWLKLVKSFISRVMAASGQITTLSQLGADWFNDSKKLRTGPLRRQLILIISAFAEFDPDDERLVLENALILDNPYTSHVTFSAPVILHLKDGDVYDYPARYHASGRAVQLPFETVIDIEYIEWKETSKIITTSENAAPFATMVKAGMPCVYTAGYPNLTVKLFLNKLSNCGLDCVHAGDADLDGFRIASEVAGCIYVSKVVAADILRKVRNDAGIEFTLEQILRLRAHLCDQERDDFDYNDELRMLLKRGHWIEQESFERILNED